MPSKSAGRIVKSQRSKSKKLTPHQKNHRWESFTSKISKLHSLDPLRKVRRHDLDAEDLSSTTSYLRNGLEKWAELNISKPYAVFKREIRPLTGSLPQILYFEDRIMGLLTTYIDQQDKESLEPLLDLLTAFAHDLGSRFEKHYPTALRLVVDIVSRPQDVEVIEWTFAALAFLFKYLARLIVPDVRPTYDAIASLMGKGKNPGYIARFAAEATSFLVKKAAAPSHREEALPLIVEHARKDLEAMAESKQYGLYSQGIMTMFAEAIKGAGHGLHSTAADIFSALMKGIPDEQDSAKQVAWTDVCCGVLTSIIHHSTSETFTPIETVITQAALAAVEDPVTSGNNGRMLVFMRLFGTMTGVRKGNRIQDWQSVIKALCKVLGTFSGNRAAVESLPTSQVWDQVIVNVAIAWNQAPIDALIPSISALTRALTQEPLMRWYIPFCSYFANLNFHRFRSLFQKDFQRYVGPGA
jgi:U3 small nucleolar RNA-associated protein 20